MSKEKVINEAVVLAQQIAQQEGLSVGQLVAHPGIEKTGTLLDIDGTAALVSFPGSVRELSLNELFDPQVAEREAVRIHLENMSARANRS